MSGDPSDDGGPDGDESEQREGEGDDAGDVPDAPGHGGSGDDAGGPSDQRDGDAPDGRGEDAGHGRTADERDASGDRDDEAARVDVAGDPLGDVEVSRGDPFEGEDAPFQQVDVDSADPDEVWERFTAEEGTATGTETAAEVGAEPPGDDVVTVSKHRFCEQCPHFTPPPEIECTHDGTRILEFVDPDGVRVSNCPVVREQRELGDVQELDGR